MSGPSVAADLESVVSGVVPALRGVSEAESAARAAAGSWSARQVLGHLIDSASNNHQRFVRAQLTEDLVFPGYEQEAWVRLQGYQEASWSALVEFWASYNLHLARLIALVPADVRLRPRQRHNLDQLAWRPVPVETPATLEYFMADYVGHLRHHLRQIFGILGRPVPPCARETPQA